MESVAWASGFKEIVWVTFALLSIHSYLRNRLVPAMFFFLLALLSKPTAVILPLLLFLLDLFQNRNLPSKLFMAVMFVMSGVEVLITKWAQPIETLVVIPNFGFRFVVAMDAVGFYLQKLFIPLNLAPDYGLKRPMAAGAPAERRTLVTRGRFGFRSSSPL